MGRRLHVRLIFPQSGWDPKERDGLGLVKLQDRDVRLRHSRSGGMTCLPGFCWRLEFRSRPVIGWIMEQVSERVMVVRVRELNNWRKDER